MSWFSSAALLVQSGNAESQGLHDNQDSLQDSDVALQLESQTVDALTQRGIAKSELEDNEGALRDFDAALKIEPRNLLALRARGAMKRRLQDLNGAIADLTACLQVQPKDTTALIERGAARREQFEHFSGLVDFNSALKEAAISGDAELKLQRARILQLMSNTPGTPREGSCQNESHLLTLQAMRKHQLWDYEGALEDSNAALALSPHSVDAPTLRGSAKKRLRDHSGAMEDVEAALTLQPKSAEFLLHRALLKMEQSSSNGRSALEDLEAALAINPGYTRAYRFSALIKQHLQDIAGALADLELAREYEPQSAEVLLTRGQLHTRGRGRTRADYEVALEDLNKALELKAGDADLLAARGNTKRLLEDYEGALRDLNAALTLEPLNSGAMQARGETYVKLKDYHRALGILDSAAMHSPRGMLSLLFVLDDGQAFYDAFCEAEPKPDFFAESVWWLEISMVSGQSWLLVCSRPLAAKLKRASVLAHLGITLPVGQKAVLLLDSEPLSSKGADVAWGLEPGVLHRLTLLFSASR